MLSDPNASIQSAALPKTDYALPSGAAPLDHLGVIALTGPDSASFIHNQLTNDFLLLDAHHARLAAYCSAKGRMQASFIGLHGPHEQLLLICSRDLLAATLKRLSMFVLRAKVKLHDASREYALWGLMGEACIALQDSAAWTAAQVDDAHVIDLYPAHQTRRQLWIGAANSAPLKAPLCSTADWALGEVLSGIATISAPVLEAFVPQMLNYESVGGVNFKKGCYPGQEVVARSQFRGTLKRRAMGAGYASPACKPRRRTAAVCARLSPMGPRCKCWRCPTLYWKTFRHCWLIQACALFRYLNADAPRTTIRHRAARG